MAVHVQLHRGTTAQNDAYTGLEGELTVDTEKHTVRVHDGSTAGGYSVATDISDLTSKVEANTTAITELQSNSGGSSSGGGDIAPSITHNGIYRGDNLLSGHFASIADIITAVRAGDFSDIYIGDYIPATVDSTERKFYVAGINKGGRPVKNRYYGVNNYLCMLYDAKTTAMYNSGMSTSGGYVGSEMYTTTLPAMYTSLAGSSGTPFYSYVLTTNEYLESANSFSSITDGVTYTTGCNLVLPSEMEVYGAVIYASSEFDMISGAEQLPIFKFSAFSDSFYGWLRNVYDSKRFCIATNELLAYYLGARIQSGCRPRFFIG